MTVPDAAVEVAHKPEYPGHTSFLAANKRAPMAKRDGMAAWIQHEIEWLESIDRTEYGDGRLDAFKGALAEFQTTLPPPPAGAPA